MLYNQPLVAYLVEMLSFFQRAIFGATDSGVGGAVALLEGIVIYYYSQHLGVSLEYIGLTNFVIGTVAVYTALLVGTWSDRSKGKFRRKPYVFLFGPLWAVGLLLRMSALTSDAGAPIYYAITYAVQVIGSTGLQVAMQGWGVELAQQPDERCRLYATTTGVGFVGIFLGIALTLFPLQLAGVVGAVLLISCVALDLIYLPDNIPIAKRTTIPTLTNIQSVFWNKQFRTYIYASACVYTINTVPFLYLYFLVFACGLSHSLASTYYTVSVLAFVIMGMATLPFIGKFLSFGKVFCMRTILLVVVAFAVGLFAASYGSAWMVVVLFGMVGGTSTVANVTLNIAGADVVDYDELLCGKEYHEH